MTEWNRLKWTVQVSIGTQIKLEVAMINTKHICECKCILRDLTRDEAYKYLVNPEYFEFRYSHDTLFQLLYSDPRKVAGIFKAGLNYFNWD